MTATTTAPGFQAQGGGILLVEMVGLTLSMASLILSLFIFCHFRNLWSTQTRLRKNLFIALGIQMIVRLIIALNQLLRLAASSNTGTNTRTSSPSSSAPDDEELELEPSSGTEFLRTNGISHNQNHKVVSDSGFDCETFLPAFILEYTRNAMFLWMFLEGLYMHSMISVFPVIHERLSLKFYYIMGWVSPIGLTCIWVMMAAKKEKLYGLTCWMSYMFESYFWILEGPKLAIILMTIFFLLNVIRILVTKLWRSSSPEVNQVRKAVSRSIILVPLLGITNYLHLQMRHSPLHLQQAAGLSSWAYATALVTSLQGVFAALIYCILNGEVQSTLKRWYIERRNEQREIIMVNGGPAGNCAMASTISPLSTESLVGIGRGNHRHHNHDSMNNNGEKRSSMSLAVWLNWGKRRRDESRAQETSADQHHHNLKRADNRNGAGGEENDETVSINPDSLSQASSVLLDPYSKEHWNEVDLSAHCNVDIEHIEIPIEYFQKYNGKKQQQQQVKTSVDGAGGGDTCPNCDLADSRRSSAFLVELNDDETGMDEENDGDGDGADQKLMKPREANA